MLAILATHPKRPSIADPVVRALVPAAGSCVGLAVALLVVLHLDPWWGGGISPATAMLSDYGLTRGWWMWDLALLLVSLGSGAILVALRRCGVLRGRAPACFLLVWCAALVTVAIFSKDPQGGAVTAAGKLHLYATGVSCGALPLAGVTVARRHRKHPRWQQFASCTYYLSLSSVPFFLPFIVPFAIHVLFGMASFPALETGLVERIMAALELGLLVVLAAWARVAAAGSSAVPAKRGITVSSST